MTARLLALCEDAVRRMRLDLSGRVVVTEAATGAYAVTPVLAAMAGAREVRALSRDSRYGTAAEAEAEVWALAPDVRFFHEKNADLFAGADIVTNSGHLRPIDASVVAWLRPGAAVSLMYEPWELRPGEVDVDACRAAGVRVAGPDEHHPAVDVFGYSGVMAIKLLLDAGLPVRGNRILLLCDNVFRPEIERDLRALGAELLTEPSGRLDAVLVALTPGPVLDVNWLKELGRDHPETTVVQFWGDLRREGDLRFWPPVAPQPGHMGVLPSAVGVDPIVALQAAGLKVGEVLTAPDPTPEDLAFVLEPA
ncbi:hypothetical protein FHX82_000748 [Amycolatopsis bartoniae]|uniref:Uncharacterized protein n=1 Tax=Amycolatopsis bartoniae TaxID=941986 RepID=A0A8H9IX16_9PSEU|nr:hypothetical protein [Amycolatopsis bartoniae]MBB2933728.1 hypothetical protein [Amycolatopsis bartoniae]TVT10602.1 hypothetical protein FNH07_05085 [Amycolatopsis bartoniae]GHF72037.1 hypothetical protein GCM10017566_52330 [Amycolatopsis bartoniae]